ncbi:hypothetical protein ADUPG1_011260 [Aduncisulcus paluster]|uniref:START domain-containing protein n=1 Tax=Aduncisulcus paluster TaxID=2918883 RepID=A0ABQ5JYV0_9EUKA|nr:hypothetical protein ADUPG1_011260 [Aduncisulcus paluster]
MSQSPDTYFKYLCETIPSLIHNEKIWKVGKGNEKVEIFSTSTPFVGFKGSLEVPGKPHDIVLGFLDIKKRMKWSDLLVGGEFLEPLKPIAVRKGVMKKHGFKKVESCLIHYLFKPPLKIVTARDAVVRVIVGTQHDGTIICAYYSPDEKVAGAKPGDEQYIEKTKYIRALIRHSGAVLRKKSDGKIQCELMEFMDPCGAIPKFVLSTQLHDYVVDYSKFRDEMWKAFK